MRGFTLLELLVVISIMAILTVIAVPSFNEYSKNQKLNDAANNLQSVLRQAQNNAQTGTVCTIGGNTYTASSWKIIFNASNYSVSPVCIGVLPPTPVSQQYSLPSGVIISAVKNKDNCGELSEGVSYKNLSSEVVFDLANCNVNVNDTLNITFCLTDSNCPDGSMTKTVSIEKGGGIYVKQ